MSKRITGILVVLVLVCGIAGAAEVKLTVEDFAKTERKGEPVTTGVPFAKGAMKDVSPLGVSVGGKKIPAQFVKTVPWPDGSVRWALMDTQVDVPSGGKVELLVADGGAGPEPKSRVKVEDGADAVTIATGALVLVISKKEFNLLKSVKVDGKELITSGGKGLVFITEKGDTVVAAAPKEVKVEQSGPMKAVVCVKGNYGTLHREMLQYTVRVTAYAGKKYIKMYVWLENQGGYGYAERAEWLNFDGMYVDLGLGLGGEVTATCEGTEAKGKLKVEQLCGNHSYSGFGFKVTSGDNELKSGARTDGMVALAGSSGKLTVAIRHFWQNYEKAIELDGANLKLWLWPTDGQWPRSMKRGASCGEFGKERKAGMYALPGGVHKGYETILDFSGRNAAAASATLSSPLMAVATPLYYATTEAAPGWFAPADFTTGDADYDGRVKAWNKMALNGVDPKGKGSLIGARNGGGDKRGFWYGWMDFGDLCWQPGACSLHYDWTWIMLLNYLRTADRRFFDMGTEMARHRIDVDQIWSDRVNPAFRGLTRYEKAYADIHGGKKDGYYKPITSHHWGCGPVLYYMLTGEEKAKECALRSAMGVELRQVNRFKEKPNSGDQPRSSGWAILLLCSVYDMTGDTQYLEKAMILWNNNLKLKWKEKDATLGCGSNIQYLYCLYPLCVLHDRSGNDEILECLKLGAATDGVDKTNRIEINHLTNLFGYVGYLTKNDEYLKKAKAHFATAVQGDDPACYGGGGAWTKESAKRLRYGHILQYACWKLKTAK